MKKILIVSFLCAYSVYAQSPQKDQMKFSFKDGTVVYGKIYSARWYKPNEKGISIQIDDKIYLHHYPFVEAYETSLPSMDRLSSYAPPSYKEYNPNCIPHCSPTRISFAHFKKDTLKSLYNKYSKVNTVSAQSISRSIVSAYWQKKPIKEREKASPKKTLRWQKNVEKEYDLFISQDMFLIWGKLYNSPKYIKK